MKKQMQKGKRLIAIALVLCMLIPAYMESLSALFVHADPTPVTGVVKGVSSVSYTFASTEDYLMLKSLLQKNGIETEAVVEAHTDSSAIILEDYIGDYLVMPGGHFEEAIIEFKTKEGGSYAAVLSFPEKTEERTITAEVSNDLRGTVLTLSGSLPADGTATAVRTDAIVSDVDVLSFEITVSDGYQPSSPITVTVTDPSIASAAQSGKTIGVLRENADGSKELLKLIAPNSDTVMFETDRFAKFSLAAAAAEPILSLTSGSASFGFSGFGVTLEEISAEAGEGLEVLHSYRVTKQLFSKLSFTWSGDVLESDRESVNFYTVSDGKIGQIISDIGAYTGDFALVKDSGYRQLSMRSGAVSLSGMLPKDVTVSTSDATAQAEPLLSGDDRAVAAYDITLEDRNSEYEPDEDHPVNVSIKVPGIRKDSNFSVIHILDDGTEERIEAVVTNDGEITFTANSFSVYVVIDHDGNTEIENPRVEFHYIAPLTASAESGSVVDGEYQYTAGPYNFLNIHNEYQASQILKDGESLELVTNPQNKTNPERFFYGWYIVNKKSSSVDWSNSEQKYVGNVTYTWTEAPVQMTENTPITVTSEGSTITWSMNGTEMGTLEADLEGTGHVYLAPIYENYYFINFRLGAKEDSTLRNTLLTRKLAVLGSDHEDSLRIDQVSAPSKDARHWIFVGWESVSSQTVTEDGIPTIVFDTDGSGNYITKTFFKTLDTDYSGEDERPRNVTALYEDGSESQNPSGQTGYYLTVKEADFTTANTIDLFPVFAEARWVYFDTGRSGNGATYVGGRYRLTNDENAGTYFTGLPKSARNGFNFKGWYLSYENEDEHNGTGVQITDENGLFVNEIPLQTNGNGEPLWEIVRENGELHMYLYKAISIETGLQLYARWEEETQTTISVVVWKQNTTADGYGYYANESILDLPGDFGGKSLAELRAMASSQVATREALRFTGFQYKETTMNNNDDSVAGDGSTVINVYFDRIVYTLTFQEYAYVYTPTESTSGSSFYGYYNADYNRVYYRNGVWRVANNDYSDIYEGPRFTRSGSQAYRTIKTITAPYEANISEYFPIVGDNGVTYNYGERWEPQNSSTFSQVLAYIDVMPNESITFRKNNTTNSMKTLNYYVEALPNEEAVTTINGVRYKLYKTINAKYGFFTEAEDFMEIVGFQKDHSDPAFNSNGRTDSSVSTLNLYYTRETHSLTYQVNYPDFIGTTFGNGAVTMENAVPGQDRSEDYKTETVLYGQQLNDPTDYSAYEPIAPDHYFFAGWYEDAACTQEFDFSSTMPAEDKVVYGLWLPETFRILIDPNGGEIDHINHKYPTYIGSSIDPRHSDVSWEFPTFRYDGVNKADRSFATYINVDYNEIVDISQEKYPPRNYVPINNAEADDMDAWMEAYGDADGKAQWISEWLSQNIGATDAQAEEAYQTAYAENEVFYYVNIQYKATDGNLGTLPADLRNALYMTKEELHEYWEFYHNSIYWSKLAYPDIFYSGGSLYCYADVELLEEAAWQSTYNVLAQKYRRTRGTEHYEFLGWYRVTDGVVEEMPYDFSKPVSEAFMLKAMWRLDGGYIIKYTPEYTMPNGNNEVINGSIDAIYDPTGTTTYSDQATTEVYGKPTDLTINGAPDTYSEFTFVHWRLVTEKTVTINGIQTSIFTPIIENGAEKTYEPGDTFVVDAKYADSLGTVHMQAVYERVNETYRRPEYANLTLDANTEHYNDRPYLSNGTEEELAESIFLQWNGPGKLALDAETEEMMFAYIQSNAAIHLKNYTIDNTYFVHRDNYLLIGFDPEADPDSIVNLETGARQAYVPNIAPDAIISVQRSDNEKLYAIWEPTVYVNLKNETHAALTVNLDSQIESTLSVVTKKNGVYERQALSRPYTITIPAGETIMLAAPHAAGKSITVSGSNTIGSGYQLTVNSHIDGDHTNENRTGDPAEVSANFGDPYTISDIIVTDPEGITFTFTEIEAERTLILDDNYEDGIRQERYFKYSETGSEALPGTNTRPGYEFLGWAETPTAGREDVIYTVNPRNLTIEDISVFFGDAETKTLYAVWNQKDISATVYVEKIVPVPGNQEKEFEFTVSFFGEYSYSESEYGRSRSRDTDSGSGSTSGVFSLTDGQYLKVKTAKTVANGRNSRPTITVTVEKYDLATDERIGSASTIEWFGEQRTHYNFSWNSIVYTIEETSDSYYITTSELWYDTSEDPDVDDINANAGTITWTDDTATNKGGYVRVTNTRKTSKVTVRKNLVDPTASTSKSFRFDGLSVNDPDNGTYTLPVPYFDVMSGSASYEFEGVPAGATFSMTEQNAAAYDMTATATEGSVTVSQKTATVTVPETDTVVTVKNELYSVPVTMIKVNQNNEPGQFGQFTLTGAGVSDAAMMPNAETGVFYHGNLYADTYTVSETPFGSYLGVNDFTLRVESDGTLGGTSIVSSDSVNVSIEGNLNEGYTIRVINRETVDVTILKEFFDPLLPQGRYFHFTAFYQIGSQAPVQIGGEHAVYTGDPDGVVLRVPVGSTLTITETDSNPVIWNTEAAATLNETGASISESDDADDVFKMNVTGSSTVVFTNSRKEVEITVVKTVVGEGNNFAFTATVKNGSNVLTDYNLNGFTAGVRRFTLSPLMDGSSELRFKIPYGAVLAIEETAEATYTTTVGRAGDEPEDALSIVLSAEETVENLTVTFTNTEVFVAPTLYTRNKAPYVFLLLMGAMLMAGALYRFLYRRKRKAGDVDD